MTAPRLHLLMNPAALDDCLGQRAEGDTVLLCDQGVVLLARPGVMERLAAAPGALAVSRVDLLSRGLRAPEAVRIVDDAELVDEVARHEQILSWT